MVGIWISASIRREEVPVRVAITEVEAEASIATIVWTSDESTATWITETTMVAEEEAMGAMDKGEAAGTTLAMVAIVRAMAL